MLFRNIDGKSGLWFGYKCFTYSNGKILTNHKNLNGNIFSMLIIFKSKTNLIGYFLELQTTSIQLVVFIGNNEFDHKKT